VLATIKRGALLFAESSFAQDRIESS